MKKTLAIIVLALGIVSAANAQQYERKENEREKGVYNKKGYQILPQAGDFAIGVDANPFLDYAFSLFDRAGSTTPTFDGFDGNLYGKYFTRNNQAIRVRLNIKMNSLSTKFEVLDDLAAMATPPNTDARVEDIRKVSASGFGLYGGYEWRRGYGRLQGFWGGELGFSLYRTKTSYEYGNDITSINQAPSTSDWAGSWGPQATRTLWTKSGMQFGLQVGAFAGVEYFFARKISLGGQVGLGLKMLKTGQGKNETETWNTTDNVYQTKENKAALSGTTAWDFSTPINGNLFVAFHF